MELKQELADLRQMVENNVPIGSLDFLEKATRLNLLLIDLDDDLIKAEMEVNRLTAELMQEDKSAAYAKGIAKGTEAYQKVLQLKAYKEHVIEIIRIAKKRVDLLRGLPEGYEH